MRAALLGNGPSRESFLSSTKDYDIIAGCNIPWYDKCDWTMILDQDVLLEWFASKNPDWIKCQCWFGPKAWQFIEEIRQDHKFWKGKCAGIYRDVNVPYDSSAHVAFRVLVERCGALEVDCYGIDVMTGGSSKESFTRKFIKFGAGEDHHTEGWRNKWKQVLDKHPQIKVEFIK